MYSEKEIVGIAKRENNSERKYLVVNRLQGKHMPVSPKKAFDMFDELADIVKHKYINEKILLVGFAETATAIGAELAVYTGAYYIQTTRENIEGVEYLFFSESHSHATEQKLIKNDLDKVIDEIDRIVFVEDEVTTGNTILNIINVIKSEYNKSLKFAVASLLNGMNKDAEEKYNTLKIDMNYLVKTEHEEYTDIAESYKGDGKYVVCDKNKVVDLNVSRYNEKNNKKVINKADIKLKEKYVANYINARKLNKGNEYGSACDNLWETLNREENFSQWQNVLVVGTEEFMYPALYVASKIEESGVNALCYSTTRSPIVVSMEKEYPLHTRYQVASLYDKDRITYIYDIASYDAVYIITDALDDEEEGVNSLINAIASGGNNEVILIRWC